jgi:hypothetical protein
MLSRRLFAIAALTLLAPAVSVREPSRGRDGALPQTVLWAWERPDDLRGLPRGIGVAFLAQTITISGRTHLVTRRRQPLRVENGTPMVAVTRIEAPGDVTGADVGAIARAIVDRGRLPMVEGVQIDFDARASQRAMYRQLLHEVRAALPGRTPLSITALASWCLDDNWLDELPVDEAVPMLFRMGPADTTLRREWARRTPASKCRGALGISLDEPAPWRRAGRRTYVFNPAPWTATAVTAALEEKE